PPLPLPPATNLQGLYHQLFEALMPQTDNGPLLGQSSKRTLEQKLAALAEISALNKKLSQIKNKRDKEKQFNRRLALNDQFKTLALQLKKLKAL
ncbi:MAG: DUF4391 domain-containing protein, partial [Colwellia sp.]